jgi:ferredoxin-NADP reductase
VNMTALAPEDHSSESVVFLSGGIGVTPFRSTDKHASKDNCIRDQDNIIYTCIKYA